MYTQQYVVAVVLFIIAGVTDVLDGYIARKYNLVTPWGKVADPLADKLMQITALMMLTINTKLPVIVLLIVIAKELFMVIGGVLLYKKDNFVVSANWYGKAATVIFYLAIIMVTFNIPYAGQVVVFAVIVTLFAFFRYSLMYRKIRSESDKSEG
jgi:Phosphatidylglycerophosphate synthase